MNEVKFKNLEDIENYKICFKCFTDDRDGYQATFHIYNKDNEEIHYKVDFEISSTPYNSDINDSGKSAKVYIDEKYGNLENCFKEIGIEYLREKISHENLKSEKVSLLKEILYRDF